MNWIISYERYSKKLDPHVDGVKWFTEDTVIDDQDDKVGKLIITNGAVLTEKGKTKLDDICTQLKIWYCLTWLRVLQTFDDVSEVDDEDRM